MIEGYLPGLVRVDPVGVAPAEVVAQALRCERLEAVAEAAREVLGYHVTPSGSSLVALREALAALVAAGATGKADQGCGEA